MVESWVSSCSRASAKCSSSSAATTVRWVYRFVPVQSTRATHFFFSAAIVMPDADLSLAVPAVFFGSVGTAGQRCTSTRRLYLHRTIAPEFLSRLQNLYSSLEPGDPLDARTLLGPLHTRAAVDSYSSTIATLKASDAQILVGGSRYDDPNTTTTTTITAMGNFVRPTIAQPVSPQGALWETERFAPVLLVAEFEELEQAIKWNNEVPQGLSSSLWTRDIRNVGKWIGPAGSDAGIVNVRVFFSSLIPFWLLNTTQRTHRSTLERVVQKSVLLLVGIRLDLGLYHRCFASTDVSLSCPSEHWMGPRIWWRCLEAVRSLERMHDQFLRRGASRARRRFHTNTIACDNKKKKQCYNFCFLHGALVVCVCCHESGGRDGSH